MGIYLNVLCEKKPDEAVKLCQKIEVPRPSDLFDQDEVEQEQLTEEDCIKRLIEQGMPEKVKERKTTDVREETKAGAEIFIAKKRNKKVKSPKSYDPLNPGPLPDPERWLPKW